jgi:hypothetical protein
MTVDLTPEDVEYLIVLVSHDIRGDRDHDLHQTAERHLTTWDKLHAALESES